MERIRKIHRNTYKVIIAISAHWFKDELYVRTADFNKQVNDMYGFPDELYQVHYEPKDHLNMQKKFLIYLEILEKKIMIGE